MPSGSDSGSGVAGTGVSVVVAEVDSGAGDAVSVAILATSSAVSWSSRTSASAGEEVALDATGSDTVVFSGVEAEAAPLRLRLV